jgi:outer membrane biosynthesis protein TonB
MRKLLLTATVLLMSVTAHADPSFQVAADDPAPVTPAVTAAEPAKPAEPAKVAEPAKAAEPAPVAEAKPVPVAKPKPRAEPRESDEHKARRIAAKYGIYW